MSENVYLLHSTEKICLWIGKLAKMEAKKHAMHTAVEYIKKVSICRGEDLCYILTNKLNRFFRLLVPR